jgi:hypothetical protein
MWTNTDNGWAIGGHSTIGKVLHDAGLNGRFHHRAFSLDLAGDKGESDIVSIAAVLGSLEVRFLLVIVPDRLEKLDQVAGGNHIAAKRTDQLDGSRIDPADVWIGVPGAVFHGHPLCSSNEIPDALFEFLPTAIDGFV